MTKITDEAVEAALLKFFGEFWKINRGPVGEVSRSNSMRAALEAALPHMSGVRVKPLEWIESIALGGHRRLLAFDAFGNEFAWLGRYNQTDEEVEAFKAEAQAEYERRILSALETVK